MDSFSLLGKYPAVAGLYGETTLLYEKLPVPSKVAVTFYITAKNEDSCCSGYPCQHLVLSCLDFRCVGLLLNFNCPVIFLAITAVFLVFALRIKYVSLIPPWSTESIIVLFHVKYKQAPCNTAVPPTLSFLCYYIYIKKGIDLTIQCYNFYSYIF